VAAVVALGGDRDVARKYGDELERRYAEAHRHYHTNRHVQAVLADCAWLADELLLRRDERALLDLAACAHDVVYDASPGADERASAKWAAAALDAAGLRRPLSDRVRELVLATLAHETADDDLVAAALLDADLAILATDTTTYDGYVAAVRREYAAIPDELWVVGRAHVLRSFADRPRIYLSTPAVKRWESAARENLSRELASLTL